MPPRGCAAGVRTRYAPRKEVTAQRRASASEDVEPDDCKGAYESSAAATTLSNFQHTSNDELQLAEFVPQ
eukprot:4988532-Pleurochrysis_carterae.AAC.3